MRPLSLLVGLLRLELDESAERLKRSEEVDVFDEHVELSWDDVESHAFVRNQNVVRDVRFNQMVEDDTGCVGKRLLSIFQLRVIVLDLGRQKQSLRGPANYLAQAHAAVEHIDLTLVLVLQRRLEEELLASLLDGEALDALSEERLARHHVEVQVVDDAVCAHRVVTQSQRRLGRHLEDLKQ